MTQQFKWGLVASMLMATGLAHATSVTIPAGTPYYGTPFYGATVSGVANLSLSSDMLATLDTVRASMGAYGAAVGTVQKDTDGYYTQASVAMPVSSLTIDTVAIAPLGVTTAGGLTLSMPALKSISSGGSLTVTDLNIDLANKKVYATLIGSNGLGTVKNAYLWDIGSVTGPELITGFDSHCGAYNDCQYLAPGMTLTGLRFTSGSYTQFSQALGLSQLGWAAFDGPADFGTITMGVVPEPGTPALMGLGLAGLLIGKRRRQGA
ncbi:hypothetical protein JY96_12195 [Aquabacterium sp. NJ1]|uniref:PEP-CTERM sorting domain-containing protein n=1 Tax=Aquabacterium sp. NJ1 TaxID=1538295 RepID=UPI00052D7704|nr:PEP-CTERM sorting domain-containing protein [Aquabacterium sp. NJ1]KGM40541.1 hypothetical protein JY96_12195 [Aquabacterium sp. NJ1]